jgi:hypothetical protein
MLTTARGAGAAAAPKAMVTNTKIIEDFIITEKRSQVFD